MIDKLKTYIMAIVIIAFATFSIITKLEVYYLTKEYNKYKENINAQVQRNIAEKTRIDAINQNEYSKVQRDLVVNRGKLSSALERLREFEAMPRGSGLSVAGCGGSSMSGGKEDTSRAIAHLITYTGTCGLDFYSDAMNDNLQCQTLIDYLNTR